MYETAEKILYMKLKMESHSSGIFDELNWFLFWPKSACDVCVCVFACVLTEQGARLREEVSVASVEDASEILSQL